MTVNDLEAQKSLSPNDCIAKSPKWPLDTFVAAVVFLASGLIFSLLRSKDIFAVDGAFRCLEVFQRPSIFFHDNNHMLYPVNVFVWTRLAGVLGFATPTRQDFHARGAHELLRGRRLAQHRFLLDQSSAALGPRRALCNGRARLLKN